MDGTKQAPNRLSCTSFFGGSKCVKSIFANCGEIHFYENEMTQTHFCLVLADVLQPLIEGQDPLKVFCLLESR